MPAQTETAHSEHATEQTTGQAAEQSAGQSADDKRETPPDPAQRRRNLLIAGVVVLLIVTVCVAWWLYARTYETTDDAQVDGHLNPVAARVDGTISAVFVEDNQRVHAGQAIVDLDPHDAEISLAQAQADYDQAVAQFKAEAPNLPIQRASNRSDLSSAELEVVNDQASLQGAQHDYDSDVAKLQQARAANSKAQNDLVRYKQLVEKQELSQSDYDQYLSTAQSDAASVDAAAATVASQKKLIEQRAAQLQEQQAKARQTVLNAPQQLIIRSANNGMRAASVESYKAKLDQARRNLAYCHVVAPVDGIVLQRSAELGGRITSGQQLLMIAQIDHAWVIANFKETQLRRMHPGQRVDIKVDALNKTFAGEVEAMAAATGDRASTLPSENATGNYVKVIQRLPVRLRFKDRQPGLEDLRAGMSVEPKVHLE